MSEAKWTTVLDLRGKDHDALRRDPNVVYVGRRSARTGWPGSEWKNPFSVGMTWAEACRVAGTLETPAPYTHLDAAACVRWYSYYLMTRPDLMARVGELKGKALACWCVSACPDEEPDVPCHAVVLMRLAEEAPDPAERDAALSLDAASV